jgi:branched-chain amino acid transport system substrate-binding protein
MDRHAVLSKLAAVALAASAALACSLHAEAAEIDIGAELALTGPYAFAGVPSRDGIAIALEEINARKLAGPHTIKLTIEDTASDKQQAISLINRFGRDDKILLVLGPSSSLEGIAVAPVANTLKVPLLTTTAISDDIIKAGEWSFRTPASAANTIGAIANYAVKKQGVKSAALVFVRDNDGAIAQKNVARDALKAAGARIVAEESVLSADTDFAAVITKLQATPVDAIFMANPSEQSANFIIQARQAGIDPKTRFIGTPAMGSARFVQVGGKAVEGTSFAADYFPAGASEQNKRFVRAFKAKFNKDPDALAALGYTSMLVAAEAIKRAGPTPDRQKIRAALAGIRDLPVVLGGGKFSFDASRAPNYGAPVLTVKDAAFVPAQ